ncbi:MAG TPA: hypothetical protein VGK67_08445 [Myxococcales bacterium]|jgi:hypothetical protein
MRTKLALVLVLVLLSACGREPSADPADASVQISCGEGTVLNDHTCVPAETVQCGENTDLLNGECVPTAAVCAPNLVFRNGKCEVPVPSANVAQFIGRTDLAVATFSTDYGWGYGVEHTFRYVGTELSQTNAAAWANSETAMVGTGLAWHVAGRIFASDSSEVKSAPVTDDTAADGSCLATAKPAAGGSLDQREIHIGLFSWNGGVAAPVACAKVGSVTFKPSSRAITLNVQFGDGTVLDKTLSMPCDNCP